MTPRKTSSPTPKNNELHKSTSSSTADEAKIKTTPDDDKIPLELKTYVKNKDKDENWDGVSKISDAALATMSFGKHLIEGKDSAAAVKLTGLALKYLSFRDDIRDLHNTALKLYEHVTKGMLSNPDIDCSEIKDRMVFLKQVSPDSSISTGSNRCSKYLLASQNKVVPLEFDQIIALKNPKLNKELEEKAYKDLADELDFITKRNDKDFQYDRYLYEVLQAMGEFKYETSSLTVDANATDENDFTVHLNNLSLAWNGSSPENPPKAFCDSMKSLLSIPDNNPSSRETFECFDARGTGYRSSMFLNKIFADFYSQAATSANIMTPRYIIVQMNLYYKSGKVWTYKAAVPMSSWPIKDEYLLPIVNPPAVGTSNQDGFFFERQDAKIPFVRMNLDGAKKSKILNATKELVSGLVKVEFVAERYMTYKAGVAAYQRYRKTGENFDGANRNELYKHTIFPQPASLKEEAKETLAKQCNNGDWKSCSTLAVKEKTNNNSKEALRLHELACKNNYYSSCVDAGVILDNSKKQKDANEKYQIACQNGEGRGCTLLGFYEKDSKKNVNRATQLFKTGCDNGSGIGCTQYAITLKAKNEQKFYSIRACQYGCPFGCQLLGNLLGNHEGYTGDPITGFYYIKACQFNNSDTCSWLGKIYSNNGFTRYDNKDNIALSYYKRACDLEDKPACKKYNEIKNRTDEYGQHLNDGKVYGMDDLRSHFYWR